MIFQVTEKQITDLSDEQLTELLRKLLIYEAQDHGIPLSSINLTLNIKAADGGLDSQVEWKGGPKRTQFILSRHVGFQCKATGMGVQQCADEIVNFNHVPEPNKKRFSGKLKKKKKIKFVETVKPMLESLFKQDGDYVLFTSKPLNRSQVEARVKAVRTKLQQLKKPYAKKANIQIFPADKIRIWVNAYLPAIVYVQFVTNQPIVPGLKTWNEWQQTFNPPSPYLPDPETQSIKESVRTKLEVPGSVVGLVGLSGRLCLLGAGPRAVRILRRRLPEGPERPAPRQWKFVRHVRVVKPADIDERAYRARSGRPRASEDGRWGRGGGPLFKG